MTPQEFVEFYRAITRPALIQLFALAIVLGFLTGKIEAEVIITLGGGLIAWWVKERSDKHAQEAAQKGTGQ